MCISTIAGQVLAKRALCIAPFSVDDLPEAWSDENGQANQLRVQLRDEAIGASHVARLIWLVRAVHSCPPPIRACCVLPSLARSTSF